jgi:hypothetical protein
MPEADAEEEEEEGRVAREERKVVMLPCASATLRALPGCRKVIRKGGSRGGSIFDGR